MLRDLISVAALYAAGWGGWYAAHRAGLVALAPPGAAAVDTWLVRLRVPPRSTSSPPHRDVDRIPDSADRSIAYARAAGVPRRDVPLVAAIIYIESRANPLAHNTDGEDSRGLMQVQLTTATGLLAQGYLAGTGVTADTLGRDLFDPLKGVQIGYAFIRYLRARGSTLEWVIRAYNGGEDWQSRGASVVAATDDYLQNVKDALALIEARIAASRSGAG